MTNPTAQAGRLRETTVPAGTSRRIRRRAIWAVALFAASAIPTSVGIGLAGGPQQHVNIGFLFALAFWGCGVIAAMAAAIPTLRYWDELLQTTRWLGALPMLTISLFLSAALIAFLF